MAVSDLINLPGLIDDAKCFALLGQHRWPQGVRCPVCDSGAVIWDGCDDTQPRLQHCRCKAFLGCFDDLIGTASAVPHQPLRVWVLCLHLIGLNLSNRQIALELGLDTSDTQAITEQLRAGLVARAPAVELHGAVEPHARAFSGIYVVAGHKSQPAAAARRGDSSSSLCTTHADAAKPCSVRSSPA